MASSPTVSNENVSNNRSPISSYASITQKIHFPSKDQAIIMDALDDIPIKEYIISVAKIVKPENIRFASRISNNRICLYLSSKTLVEELTTAKTKLIINGHSISIRPLSTRSKRIILSNVCPVIPHSIIEDHLKNLQIRILSPVTFIKAGYSEPGFSHILSFRRQIYIHPDDETLLPANFQVQLNDDSFWIFASSDNLTCFLCKKEGHLAKQCPINKKDQPRLSDTTISSPDNAQPSPLNGDASSPPSVSSQMLLSSDPPDAVPSVNPGNNTNKRPLSLTNSIASTHDPANLFDCTSPSSQSQVQTPAPGNRDAVFIKPSSPSPCLKKRKKGTQDTYLLEDFDRVLNPVKDILSLHPNAYVIDYAHLIEFLHNSVGHSNVIELANTYTPDIAGLIHIWRDIHPHLTERFAKNRVTRITKKLELHLSWNEDPSSRLNSPALSDQDSDKDSSTILDDDVSCTDPALPLTSPNNG